jgi:hypothetical protein
MPVVAQYKVYQSNRAHVQKFNERKQFVLQDRVKNMKPSVDNGLPEGFKCLINQNQGRRSAVLERNTLIAKTNKKLNARLDYIRSHKSNIGKNEYYIPASKRRNPFGERRILSVRQIYNENKKLCRRLKEILESSDESMSVAHGEHPDAKERMRLKQTFEAYTNGVKAELDHYQMMKKVEKKHHLMYLKKMKQRKLQRAAALKAAISAAKAESKGESNGGAGKPAVATASTTAAAQKTGPSMPAKTNGSGRSQPLGNARTTGTMGSPSANGKAKKTNGGRQVEHIISAFSELTMTGTNLKNDRGSNRAKV